MNGQERLYLYYSDFLEEMHPSFCIYSVLQQRPILYITPNAHCELQRITLTDPQFNKRGQETLPPVKRKKRPAAWKALNSLCQGEECATLKWAEDREGMPCARMA